MGGRGSCRANSSRASFGSAGASPSQIEVALGVILLLFAAAANAAPPQLNYLFPAGGRRGASVEVTADGAFSNWPPEVWVDRDGVRVEAGEKKGMLKVVIDEGAEAGVYWLRVYDVEGASALRPFIVGSLREMLETEPNDDPVKPQSLDNAAVVINGKFNKQGDVDGYAVELEVGQTLVASLEAHETLASPLDAVLQVTNREGFVLEQNDDGRGLDPLLVFEAPDSGTYLVRAFCFPSKPNSTIDFAGGEDHVYRLTITTGGFLDHTMPLAVAAGQQAEVRAVGWNIPAAARSVKINPPADAQDVVIAHPEIAGSVRLPVVDVPIVLEDDGDAPQRLELPAVVSGTIALAGEVDDFILPGKKGQKLTLTLESRSLGLPLDAVLQVVNAAGEVVQKVDDVSTQRDPTLEFAPPADEDYTLQIFDLHRRGGPRFAYRLRAEAARADFQLTLAGGEFVITPGKPLEIPVAIVRTGGFAEEIEITAVDLPPGVTAAPVKSLAKGDSAKGVKLVVTATADAAGGAIRIVGHAATDQASKRVARFTVADGTATHDRAWLTVVKK